MDAETFATAIAEAVAQYKRTVGGAWSPPVWIEDEAGYRQVGSVVAADGGIYVRVSQDAERILANGEVWTLRGREWHMTGYEPSSIPFDGDYAPISSDIFEDYARTIAAGAKRLRERGL